MFYQNERIAIFIDGVNLHGMSKALSFDIDFKKLRDSFAKKGRLMHARYYTTILESEDFSPIKPLVDWLDYNGYIVSSKLARDFTDGSGRRKVKGTMNVEMAVDALTLSANIDHLVLISGDGELRSAVEALQRQGVRVSVCSSLKTNPPMVSDDLRRQADHFIEFADLEETVGRPKK
jgi:uncharacterized LabA/DUF88 family protein